VTTVQPARAARGRDLSIGALPAAEAPPPAGEVASSGPERVDLLFTPNGNRVRVPPGVTLFDAASWNGIAIDSTCGGHGTCKKCKVQITGGTAPVSSLDARAFGDRGDAGRPRAQGRMELDGCLDDPPSCLGLALGARLELVLPFHCTILYIQFDSSIFCTQ